MYFGFMENYGGSISIVNKKNDIANHKVLYPGTCATLEMISVNHSYSGI